MFAFSKAAPAATLSQTASSAHATRSGKTERNDEDPVEPVQGKKPERRKIALISASDLIRDCPLLHFGERLDADIAVFASVDGWMRQDDAAAYSLIILHAHGDHLGREIASLDSFLECSGGRPHFVVMGDSERQADVMASFKHGAQGFIPTSASPEFMIQVIRFVFIGGVYCPPFIGQA